MKPITWLRKFTDRGFRGYPLASLGFYGPDDRKACAEEGIPKDGQARARLATRKAQSGSWQ
jgi:hypothetical protein